MLKTMYCNNCGDKGHVFRECPEPVTSCGILFLRGIYEPLKFPIDPMNVSVLMVRRKDSMSYMEFIRGKYDSHNIDYIKRLFSNMTLQEQQSVLNEPFDALWTRLWGNSRDKESFEFSASQNKWASLNIKKLIQESPSKFNEPEWGFPKGRRARGESDLECAIREFYEETNIPKEAYHVLENLTFTETFVATNDIKYKHKYFVAVLRNSKLFDITQKLTVTQKREISSIDWKTLAECKKITRPHYVERKKMITELERSVSLASK
jgi:8-oxo-dGTP pyrophosphatase MutT (NUDIX family)